ncbi:YfcC family protein [Anaerosphaera multitolerans]|uniref:YfcC family protein n=1 Tax=Anaerosphaera multitolerans TaxID=2487351 RepID=A0A437S5W3_9FIRM|nr:YfcC family protein [Anaerosphaera multitolerans]RVU54357.1 YfcC family protein [Anaerosphaera multitolerans]
MTNKNQSPLKKKQKGNINPYMLLFTVIVVCGLLSFVVSPGAYDREIINDRTVVDPNSYHVVERTPVSFLDFFRAIPYGLIGSGNVVFLILLVGGVIEILNETGSLGMGIHKIIQLTGKKDNNLIIWIFMIFFSILGGFLGWVEAAIPFVPIVVPIIISLGYDAMTAGAVVILGLLVSFAVGPTNVYTVGIAHDVAELPMFSGIEFRLVVYIVFVLTAILYTSRYAKKVKRNPELSLTKDVDVSRHKIDFSQFEDKIMTTAQKFSLLTLLITFIVVMYGMLKMGWNINDMTAAFLVCGIIVAIINKMGVNKTVDTMLVGMKGSLGGAMIVGVARGVQWILETGGTIDPIIHGLAEMISGWPTFASAIGIFIVVSLLNGLVPSGSGKAVALMPLIIPLADLVGITRQTSTLAYQFGDGLTNMAWFTYGTLLMFLSMADVPLKKWYKFIMPLMLILTVYIIFFLFIAVKIGYGPF